MICVFFFLASVLPAICMKPVSFISKNINRYYCVHSVIIFWIGAFIISTGLSKDDISAPVCYLLAFSVIAATTFIAWLYSWKLRDILVPFFAKHAYVWTVIVLVLSIAACCWASLGPNNFPNLVNDYEGWM